MRIYCCTPASFPADEDSFFSRESGLFCRTFQFLGIESRSVMLLPGYPQDSADVLRGRFQDFCNPAWWRSMRLDGLILYSWGAPKYNAVAKAIHEAGIPTVIYMDTCGLVSRLGNCRAWWQFAWRPAWASGGNLLLKLMSLAKFLVDSLFLVTARRRISHLDCSHAVTLPTRQGVIWMKRELSCLGRPDLANKIFYSPHPQNSLFRYDHAPKENIVICVARFLPEDWPQKRPALLIKSLNEFMERKLQWQALVVGRGATQLTHSLGIHSHPSIFFEENLAHKDLVFLYQKAKIGFWTSLLEGQQGAAAQALCCGCSVVAPSSPLNSCFADYVCQSSGRLALDSSVCSLADALYLESEDWANGHRLPDKISLYWSALLHSEGRARAVLRLLKITLPVS
jgi:glycosyltransferase involved in cell wall biosynthesis